MVRRLNGIILLLIGASSFALAGGGGAPEIDASTAVGAVALLAGGLVVLRARRRTR